MRKSRWIEYVGGIVKQMRGWWMSERCAALNTLRRLYKYQITFDIIIMIASIEFSKMSKEFLVFGDKNDKLPFVIGKREMFMTWRVLRLAPLPRKRWTRRRNIFGWRHRSIPHTLHMIMIIIYENLILHLALELDGWLHGNGLIRLVKVFRL